MADRDLDEQVIDALITTVERLEKEVALLEARLDHLLGPQLPVPLLSDADMSRPN